MRESTGREQVRKREDGHEEGKCTRQEKKTKQICSSNHRCTCSSKRVINKFAHSSGFCVPIAVRGSVTSRHHVRRFISSLRAFDIDTSPFTNVDCRESTTATRSFSPVGEGRCDRDPRIIVGSETKILADGTDTSRSYPIFISIGQSRYSIQRFRDVRKNSNTLVNIYKIIYF